MKKHGITIDCAGCQFIGSHERGSFDVVVPVADENSGLGGRVRLSCRASSQTHVVKLAAWQDQKTPVVAPGSDLDRRLTKALAFVADKRLCGNRSLCPSQVVDLVEKASEAD
jgi:hypothetical protein